MMTGRFGAVIGNVIFPLLLALGCLPPFLMVGLMLLGKYLHISKLTKTNFCVNYFSTASSILGVLLPNTSKDALK